MQPPPSLVQLPSLRPVTRSASASIDDDIFAVVRAILQVGNNLLLPASNLAAACFGLESGLRLGEIPQAQDTERRRLPLVACLELSIDTVRVLAPGQRRTRVATPVHPPPRRAAALPLVEDF